MANLGEEPIEFTTTVTVSVGPGFADGDIDGVRVILTVAEIDDALRRRGLRVSRVTARCPRPDESLICTTC
jgi:hypothetical protein